MRSASLMILLVLGACGGGAGQPGRPLHTFPTRTDVARLAQIPQPQGPITVDYAVVDQWTLQPRADTAPRPEHASLPRLAPNAAHARALDCVAFEIGRIVAERGVAPDFAVRRFISARCGAVLPLPQLHWWTMPAQAASDSQVVEALNRQLTQPAVTGARQAGIALVRGSQRIVIALASGTPDVEIQELQQIAKRFSPAHWCCREILFYPAGGLVWGSGVWGTDAWVDRPARIVVTPNR